MAFQWEGIAKQSMVILFHSAPIYYPLQQEIWLLAGTPGGHDGPVWAQGANEGNVIMFKNDRQDENDRQDGIMPVAMMPESVADSLPDVTLVEVKKVRERFLETWIYNTLTAGYW